MATSQLDLYNRALEILGERSLASLTENREPRRILDAIWPSVVNFCLNEGCWKFALRSSQMIADPSIAPIFGYKSGWMMPADWVRTVKVCSDEYLTEPMTRYSIEGGVFFCDYNYTFVQYVSNDPAHGGNLNLWSESFAQYVACYMATRACKRITQSETELQRLTGPQGKSGLLRTLLLDARSKDAMELPTQFLPRGAWAVARTGYGTTRRDGGSRANLIG